MGFIHRIVAPERDRFHRQPPDRAFMGCTPARIRGLSGETRGLLAKFVVEPFITMKDAPTGDPASPAQNHSKRRRAEVFVLALAACVILGLAVIVLVIKVRHRNALITDTLKQLVQAKSETTLVQAELDKAKDASTQLQSQLDKAKTQQTDLQTKVDQSKDALAQLQAQVDRDKTQSADLQAQLDKAKAQSADLQAQVSQATAGSAQLLTQLDQAKIQSLDLQTRLQTAESDIAQLQPLLMKARHMPVTTSFENVHGGRGFTLKIMNLYPQPLTVNITIEGAQKSRSQSNVIAGGATLNVDKLAAGEKVVIASEGCDPVNLTVQ